MQKLFSKLTSPFFWKKL